MPLVVHAADVLQSLRKYDTPTICNVVELFDLIPRTAGYMNGSIQACYPALPPMVLRHGARAGTAIAATYTARISIRIPATSRALTAAGISAASRPQRAD